MKAFRCTVLVLAMAPAVVAQESGIVLGAYVPRHYDGGPDPTFSTQLAIFDGHVGKHHPLIIGFTNWERPITDDYYLNQMDIAGVTPMLGWYSQSRESPPENFSYDRILSGAYDSNIIRPSAQLLRDYGKPVLLEFDAEMNLRDGAYHAGWPWNESGTHTGPQGFVKMWRHVVGIFREEGATNVQWVWSPNYSSDVEGPNGDYVNYYPGSAYVDWVGTHGFNWNGYNDWAAEWALQIYTPILTDFSNRYPDKPQIISHVGSDDGGSISKTEWITDAFSTFFFFPNVHACVWWNDYAEGGKVDFRISTNYPYEDDPVPANVAEAYRNAIAGPAFLTHVPDPGDFVPREEEEPLPPPTHVSNYINLTAAAAVESGGKATLTWYCDFSRHGYRGVPVNAFLAAILDPAVVNTPSSVEDALAGGTVYLYGKGVRDPYAYAGTVYGPTWRGIAFPPVATTGLTKVTVPGPPGKYVFAVALFHADGRGPVRGDGLPVEVSNSFTQW